MAFLDAVNTITQKTILPGMVDQVFKSGPTMAFIKRNCLEKWATIPGRIVFCVMVFTASKNAIVNS